MTTTRSVLSVTTVALALAALTACGSDGGGGTTPAAGSSATTSASASTSPAPTDGKQLVTDATDALDAADSFHISGTIADGSESLTLDVTYGADGTAAGTLEAADGASIEVRRVDGTVYANGTAEFYAQAAAQDSTGPDLSSVAGTWVVVDDSAPDVLQGAVSFLDRDDLVDSLRPDGDADETYEISGPEDVDGTSSYIVTDQDGDTFAVAAEGDPLPVEISNNSDGDGSVSFDGYGDDVDVQAPDDSEITPLPAS